MRLIDADALISRMYHDAFETDTYMQKWDSGCWIRYKLFENAIDAQPTIDAVSVVRCAETQPETKMVTQNSNKNSNVISVYDGVSEAVRCAMCSNPNKSDRGCDGACSYDEKLYERIMRAIAESVADTPQTERSE